MRTGMILAATAAILMFHGVTAVAQDNHKQNGPQEAVQLDSIPEGYELVDTLVYIRTAQVDSALAGRNIFVEMPLRMMGGKGDVKVHQSLAISTAMNRHFIDNSSRTIQGYRVRIFFDNRQSARTDSEETLRKFESRHHGVAAYRSYVNPYFKVTVGDFRTRSEAMQLLMEIKSDFPAAFIVKENINYPVIDKENAFSVDTVKVLRPLDTEAVKL